MHTEDFAICSLDVNFARCLVIRPLLLGVTYKPLVIVARVL